MHHRKLFLNLTLGALVVLSQSFGFAQASFEKTSDRLTRSAGAQQVQTILSKNIFRSVPYQANYDEQVPYQDTETYYEQIPYQDTETYTEQIPYQDTETYTDYESYNDQEYRCHNERQDHQDCRTEQDCRNVGGGKQCRDQQVCSNQGGGQHCQDVEECGVNAQGKKICKTRQVCTNEPGRQECHNENKCYEVPGERQCTPRQVCTNNPQDHQVCNYETVTKTRPVQRTRTVTKYRQEQRTRDVTKYRQEARTRTVTKYRAESKCCVTQYRDEFDHQAQLEVIVQFPADAVLQPDEQETLKVVLSGDEAQPSAQVSFERSVYIYQVASQILNGHTFIIQLASTGRDQGPVIDNQEVFSDPQALTNWDLLGAKTQTVLNFRDQAPQHPFVKTKYKILISRRTSSGLTPLVSAAIDRSQVRIDSEGLNQISLVKDLHMDATLASSSIVSGAELQVDIEIERSGPRLNDGKPVSVRKSFIDRNRD